MSLLGELKPTFKRFRRFRRTTVNERIVRQCRTLWAQRGLSELKIEELCGEIANDLEEAAEAGYGPEVVVGSGARELAEEMAEVNAPPKTRVATAYKTALIALVSLCAVLVPQHVLLSSWTIPVGWSEIAAPPSADERTHNTTGRTCHTSQSFPSSIL